MTWSHYELYCGHYSTMGAALANLHDGSVGSGGDSGGDGGGGGGAAVQVESAGAHEKKMKQCLILGAFITFN